MAKRINGAKHANAETRAESNQDGANVKETEGEATRDIVKTLGV